MVFGSAERVSRTFCVHRKADKGLGGPESKSRGSTTRARAGNEREAPSTPDLQLCRSALVRTLAVGQSERVAKALLVTLVALVAAGACSGGGEPARLSIELDRSGGVVVVERLSELDRWRIAELSAQGLPSL